MAKGRGLDQGEKVSKKYDKLGPAAKQLMEIGVPNGVLVHAAEMLDSGASDEEVKKYITEIMLKIDGELAKVGLSPTKHAEG